MVNTIFNWAIVAIVSSFTMMPASINRQTAPISEPVVEEAELKGCATNFDDDLIPFYYDGPNYSKGEVEDLNNWAYDVTTDPDDDCDQDNEVACALLVHESFVDQIFMTLEPTFSISATEVSGKAFVSSISLSGGKGEIFNRSE